VVALLIAVALTIWWGVQASDLLQQAQKSVLGVL
jgi:hypothetical protein